MTRGKRKESEEEGGVEGRVVERERDGEGEERMW